MLFNRKYNLSIVRKLQQEGKIPKFRIAETKDTSGKFTHFKLKCVLWRIYLQHQDACLGLVFSDEDWNIRYPKIEANTWVSFAKYASYIEGRDYFVKTYLTKKAAQSAIDWEIIILLKEIKLSTTYEEYP